MFILEKGSYQGKKNAVVVDRSQEWLQLGGITDDL